MGIVYIATNPAMVGYVKIGRTDNSADQRIKELDGTNVPFPFECGYAVEVEDPKNVERLLHDVFQDFRVRKNREFFDIKIERVISALQLTGGKEIESNTSTTNEDVDPEALEKANRRSNINLLTLKISIGDTLHFTENTDIKCTVKSAREVEFDGQVMSLTQAALQARILNAQINNTEEIRSPSISGSDYWCFESDKTLHTRRLRIEQEA